MLRQAFRPLTTIRSYTTVPLSYTKYPAPQPSQNAPLIVCHGLFGSKQNWRSLGKSMSVRLSRDVYTLDMRNHGESPHAEEHTYDAMSHDLVSFMEHHKLEQPILLGHSMGGKVVMTTALQHPTLVKKLVVVDIAPFSLPLSSDFGMYIDAMRKIDQANVKKQSEADKMLQEFEPDMGIRMFLLTNLKKSAKQDGQYHFRIPYDILGKALGNMGDFSKMSDQLNYSGPTLFIAGGKSSYCKPLAQYPDKLKAMFPDYRLDVVEGAGHWVHAEKPDVFMKYVTNFVGQKD
ncbi:Alpha/Beta hydrolase protein [Zychaea mexicana]|uniref:Alpha/Beta hydrolase protein n=1 Tax=Zychaea mexicana TaxID=64656 RepID=UPI0022FDF2D1|nr:Alpha/Beta hydrolase protein [Zychaea mexicana]KAI9498886.1 Alpha/Beta hydrolase protein [Zychaea mexicana]